MTLHANQPDAHKHNIFLDGEDISKVVRYADEEQGVAYCVVPIKPRIYACTNDLPRDWSEEIPPDVMLLYEVQGKIEIVRQDGTS